MVSSNKLSFPVVIATLCVTAVSSFAAAKKSADYCKKDSGVEFADTSIPVSDKLLTKMQEIGAKTIGRYYDYPNETIKGKRLRKEELKLLEDYKLSLLVVFQHNNNKASTFKNWKTRGPEDATEALRLAKQFKQPSKSAIYFGVDGDFVGKSSESSTFYTTEVLAYFGEINRVFREQSAGFKIGVYGSGAACKELTSKGLVAYCWLSHSHGFYGTKDALATQAYDLEQYLPADCGGDLDFGKLKAGVTNFGQFPAKALP